ncbi:MAG: TetR/AcrR family transcriptional regulator [Roseovarius sp.]|nr:TetR/AcrR family transcriptional regulator [Roseovarius sp.]
MNQTASAGKTGKTRKTRGSAGQENPTREGILEAAAQLIVSEGFNACTMRSISQRVNIKAGSLYYHFASKDEIVVEIMNKGTQTLLEQVRSAVENLPDSTPMVDRLRRAVHVHISCKVDRDLPLMQVYEHLTPVIKRQGRIVRKKYSDFWKDLFAQGKAANEIRADLDLDLFTPYILSGLNRAPEWANLEHMKIEDVVDMVVETIMNGIAPKPAT